MSLSLSSQDFIPHRASSLAEDSSPSPSSESARKVFFHVVPRAADMKAAAEAAPAGPLAARDAQVLEAQCQTHSELETALQIVDEAHARLRAQVDARGGRDRFAQPSGSRRGVRWDADDLLDPDAPDMLMRLTLLRNEMIAALRLAEPGGMLGAGGRAAESRRLQEQVTRLTRAFHRWEGGLSVAFDSRGVCLRPVPGKGGMLARAELNWEGVSEACRLLAQAPGKGAPGALHGMIQDRIRDLKESQTHHPCYLPRLLQAKAMYWDAAAETLEALIGNRDLKSYRVRTLQAPPAPAPAPAPEGKHGALPREDHSSRSPSRNTPSTAAPSPASTSAVSTPARSRSPASAFASPESQGKPMVSLSSLARADATASPERAPGQGDDDPIRRLAQRFRAHRDDLLRQAQDPANDRLGDPVTVLGLDKKAKSPSSAQQATWLRQVLHEDQFPEAVTMPAQDFALACVKQAVAETRAAAAGPSAPGALASVRRWWRKRTGAQADATPPFGKVKDKQIDKAFKRISTQLLSRRANPVVRSTVVVPTLPPAPAAEPADGLPLVKDTRPLAMRRVCLPLRLRFEQRPAIAVSSALADSLAADGVQGAHCHERTQHKHALNLFVSKMESDGGRARLTITRHGVLSPSQLRSSTIDSLSDEDLYRMAVDLADDLAKPPFNDKRLLNALQQNRTFDDLPGDADAPARAQPSPAKFQAVVALVRGKALPKHPAATPESRAPRAAALQTDDPRVADHSAPPPLIDVMRRAAALNRAREVAQAALASLPDEELTRLVQAAGTRDGKHGGVGRSGAPATVRLASVSLMTPDAYRFSYKNDERSMWRDQARAWADLARLGAMELPMPALDREGNLRRDPSTGRLIMAGPVDGAGTAPAMKVRFDVAAMNFPVNPEGTWGKVSGAILGAHSEARQANEQAISQLLGTGALQWAKDQADLLPTLVRWARREKEVPQPPFEGWLGERLRDDAVPEKEKQILRTLGTQIISIFATGAYKVGGNDPYKLATRLIVLTNRLGGPTAALVNCKSGKDRTSAAESEARQMAVEIATTGKVPSLGAEVTEMLSRQLGAIHESGGSREVQAWNTGLAGSKLKGSGLFARYALRDKDQTASFVGLSSFTSS